jgi:hypothetical protein
MTFKKFVVKYEEKKMTNKKILSGMLAWALVFVFGLVLAGCATGGGGAESSAEKLAADINAIEAEKTTVSGGTVTLTGWAGLNTALTVPEGVTLDLTQDGATLELQDGAVLTVNGTMNATGYGNHGKGWAQGSLRSGGTAVIAGTGTIYLTGKGRLLSIGSDEGHLQLTLDGVTLVGVSDNSEALVFVGGKGGGFVLKSGAITGNTRVHNEGSFGGGVEVREGGLFTMEGGVISGNGASAGKSSGGGGVAVEGAAFTMSGGMISGNTAVGGETGIGGGVRLTNFATFTMSGGTISGNSATGEGWSGSGGVRVQSGSAFIMEGGTIYGKASSLPAGTDASLANSAEEGTSLSVDKATAKWGAGGTYQGGESQTGGGDIIVHVNTNGFGGTDDTLIAAPGR